MIKKIMLKITHRFGWKILSIILAFFLWLLVVNYEDPVIPKSFSNITVNVLNASSITSQNKAIEYKDGATVSVKVKGNRSIIDKLTADDIKAYADISKVSITGAVDIDIETVEGVDIVSKTPADMTIAWENIVTQQKAVQYYFEGEPASSYEALDPVITPNVVQITGPESQVNMVSSVVVPISIDGASKDMTLFATPQALDSSKNEVASVNINVDRVSVMVPIEKTRTIPIVITDPVDLPDGYVITDKAQELSSVTIRGQESVVDAISSININDLSLADKTGDTTISVELSKYLPDSIYVKNNNKYVNIVYSIEKLEEKTLSVEMQDIMVKNIPDGMKFSYIDEQPIELTLKGIQSDLDSITLESLSPYIKLYGLSPGEQQVPLYYTIPKGVTLTSDEPQLNIKLVEETQTTTTGSTNDTSTGETGNSSTDITTDGTNNSEAGKIVNNTAKDSIGSTTDNKVETIADSITDKTTDTD